MTDRTLMALLTWARDLLGPDQRVLPLVLRRLRQGLPQDAAARRELAWILGVPEELATEELASVLPPAWFEEPRSRIR